MHAPLQGVLQVSTALCKPLTPCQGPLGSCICLLLWRGCLYDFEAAASWFDAYSFFCRTFIGARVEEQDRSDIATWGFQDEEMLTVSRENSSL